MRWNVSKEEAIQTQNDKNPINCTPQSTLNNVAAENAFLGDGVIKAADALECARLAAALGSGQLAGRGAELVAGIGTTQ